MPHTVVARAVLPPLLVLGAVMFVLGWLACAAVQHRYWGDTPVYYVDADLPLPSCTGARNPHQGDR